MNYTDEQDDTKFTDHSELSDYAGLTDHSELSDYAGLRYYVQKTYYERPGTKE